MSATKLACDKDYRYLPIIKCNPYESQIYSQLQPIEKKGILTCGVKESKDLQKVMKLMFFTDQNYFDAYWHKKLGAFHNTTYDYKTVLLKQAKLPNEFDMIIPRKYTPEELGTEETVVQKIKAKLKENIPAPQDVINVFARLLKSEKPIQDKDISKELDTLKAITLEWHEPPTNKLSHSLYLNIDFSIKAKETRAYELLLLDCKPPFPPPPTPPEILAKQEMAIKHLEYCIELVATQTIKLINAYFEHQRDSQLQELVPLEQKEEEDAPVNTEPVKTEVVDETDREALLKQKTTFDNELLRKPGEKLSVTARKKLKKGKQFTKLITMENTLENNKRKLEIYRQNVATLLDIRNKIAVTKYDINMQMKLIEEMETKIKIPPSSLKDSAFSWLKTITIVPKLIEKSKEFYNYLQAKHIPTMEDLAEQKSELQRMQKNLQVFQRNYERAKVTYKQMHTEFFKYEIKDNKAIKGLYYEKSTTEKFADGLAGVTQIPDAHQKLLKELSIRDTITYKSNCTWVGQNYEAILLKSFTLTINFVNQASDKTKQEILPKKDGVLKPLLPIQTKILETMMQFPLLDKKAFGVYQQSFEFPHCEKKPTKRGPAATQEMTDSRSFLWVSFESAVDLLTK